MILARLLKVSGDGYEWDEVQGIGNGEFQPKPHGRSSQSTGKLACELNKVPTKLDAIVSLEDVGGHMVFQCPADLVQIPPKRWPEAE